MDKIIVLAAGKGTRMNSDLPKVMVPVSGKPMISYLMESIKKSGIDNKPIIVVSPDNIDVIKESLKDFDCEYVVQDKQLGTGHALSCSKDFIGDDKKNIIVFYGDHPFIQPDTIKKLSENHFSNSGQVTMMTSKLPDFNNWRKNFYAWGRIIRDGEYISNIKEFKDATEEQKLITEVNPGLYCFDNEWLWKNIDKLKNDNNQKEYYLTDLIKIAFDQGIKINDISVDPTETVGINSLEELEVAEGIYNKYFNSQL